VGEQLPRMLKVLGSTTSITKRYYDTGYLQIFYLNIDVKILNKILASIVKHYIKLLVHHNQIELIMGMQG
jgi:hypothetical protein